MAGILTGSVLTAEMIAAAAAAEAAAAAAAAGTAAGAGAGLGSTAAAIAPEIAAGTAAAAAPEAAAASLAAQQGATTGAVNSLGVQGAGGVQGGGLWGSIVNPSLSSTGSMGGANGLAVGNTGGVLAGQSGAGAAGMEGALGSGLNTAGVQGGAAGGIGGGNAGAGVSTGALGAPETGALANANTMNQIGQGLDYVNKAGKAINLGNQVSGGQLLGTNQQVTPVAASAPAPAAPSGPVQLQQVAAPPSGSGYQRQALGTTPGQQPTFAQLLYGV